MSNYWDELLQEHIGTGGLPSSRRELLKMFYLWLVNRGVIE
jgi:hypothetical protein